MVGCGAVSGGAIEAYYGRDDYYFKADLSIEMIGSGKNLYNVNLGSAKTKLECFSALSEGRKTRAFDLCFSAPKSVSVAFACASPELRGEIDKRNQIANKKTLEYIEKNGYFRVQKKENGIVKSYAGKGMVAAAIPHSVNRNLDPNLHIHNLISNGGYIDGEGEFRALDSRQLFKNQMHFDQVYKAFLRVEMEKLGLSTRTTEIETKKGHVPSFELACINQKQIDNFSTRKADIDAELEARGSSREVSSRAERQAVSELTRNKKTDEKAEVLIEGWQKQGAELGIKIEANKANKSVGTHWEAEKYCKLAVDELNGSNVSFTRQELTDKALQLSALDNKIITQTQVESASPKALKLGEMIRLPGQTRTENLYSQEQLVSKKLLRAEAENQRYLIDGKDKRKGLDQRTAENRIDHAAKRVFDFQFKGEQREAAIGILTSKDLLTGIQGDPGTGKTTLLNAVAEAHGRNNILGLSVAGVAAKKLGDETGLSSNTVAKFLRDYDQRQEALKTGNRPTLSRTSYLQNLEAGRGLIIVDEASMLGSIDANRLCQIAHKQNAKIVLVGDRYQLPGVAAGKPFEKWQAEGLQTFELKEIRRQRSESDLAAVEAITLRHDAKEAIKIMQVGEKVKEISNSDNRLNAIVKRYVATVKNGESAPLLITGTNKDKDALNTQIREQLMLSGTGEKYKTVNSKGRDVEREFAVGDRLVFLKGDNNGQCKTSDESKILNGSQGIIQGIEDGKFKVGLVDDEGQANGKTASFNIEKYQTVDHAYALSTYKSQGQSVERDVIYHAPSDSPILSKNEMLVGISRNKNNVEIYTDNAEKMTEKASYWVEKDDGLQAFTSGIETEVGNNGYISRAQEIMATQLDRQEQILIERQRLTETYGGTTAAPTAERLAFNESQNKARKLLREDLAALATLAPINPDKIEKSTLSAVKTWQQKQAEIEAGSDEIGKGNAARQANASDKKLMSDLYLALPDSQEQGKPLDRQIEQANKEIEQIRNQKIDFKYVDAYQNFRLEIERAAQIHRETNYENEDQKHSLSKSDALRDQRGAREVLPQDDRSLEPELQQASSVTRRGADGVGRELESVNDFAQLFGKSQQPPEAEQEQEPVKDGTELENEKGNFLQIAKPQEQVEVWQEIEQEDEDESERPGM